MDKSQTATFGPKPYTRWARDENDNRVVVASKRNFFQRIDKIERLSGPALARYHSMFSAWFNVADLIVLQRVWGSK